MILPKNFNINQQLAFLIVYLSAVAKVSAKRNERAQVDLFVKSKTNVFVKILIKETKTTKTDSLLGKVGHKPFLANIFRKKKLATKHPTHVQSDAIITHFFRPHF